MRDCSWIFQPPYKELYKNVRLGNIKCTSDRTDDLPGGGYNCIAWAAGKTDTWWWPIEEPGVFWPVPIDPIDPVTLDQFIMAFKSQGFASCKSSRFQNGFEKVAIFVDREDEPTHAARLLPNGVWTSKMGQLEDIEHKTLRVLKAKAMGRPKHFYADRIPIFS